MSLLWVMVLLLAGAENSYSHQMGPHPAPADPDPRSRRDLGPCFPNPCFHKGVCQVINHNPNCTCKPGFTGAHCKDMIVKLECKEEYMTMMVRMEVFDALKIPLKRLHLKNPVCNISEYFEDGKKFWGIKLLGINHTKCGSVIKVNESHVSYSNMIVSDSMDQNESSVIMRSVRFNVNFTCIYAYKNVVGLPYSLKGTDTIAQFEVKEGAFTVTMALYDNDTFERAYRRHPLVLLISDTLHVLLQIDGQEQAKYFYLTVDNCWGTPTANPLVEPKHDLIIKGCPNDVTLKFFGENGGSTSVKFSFQMFQFRNATQVFLHCEVRLCIPERPIQNTCRKNCGGNATKHKRELDEYKKIVSYGPIQLLKPAHLQAQSADPSNDQQSLEGLLLWIPTVLCFAAVTTTFILTAVVKSMKK